jgi:enoyl-CoA hydratase/carnithine racemase
MAKSAISVDKRGPAAWLTLASLDVRVLQAACESLADEAAVRAVIVRVGVELVVGEGLTGDPFWCLAELRKPVIAVASGETSGPKLPLALAADIRVASDDSTFAVTELSQGGLPVAGTIARLVRLVGRGKAIEMVLTGEAIPAGDARRIGLVGEVIPAKELEARAQAIAEKLAERAPLALHYAKEAVQRGLEMPLEQALRFETDLTVILQTTEDRAEGVRAFLEKRKPDFKGR